MPKEWIAWKYTSYRGEKKFYSIFIAFWNDRVFVTLIVASKMTMEMVRWTADDENESLVEKEKGWNVLSMLIAYELFVIRVCCVCNAHPRETE